MLGVKRLLEPMCTGPVPWTLEFRHKEASQISEAPTVGLELWLGNGSGALQVVRDVGWWHQCQHLRATKDQSSHCWARGQEPQVLAPVFQTLCAGLFFWMSTHFGLTYGPGVHDMHSACATCDLPGELDDTQTGLHSVQWDEYTTDRGLACHRNIKLL